MLGYGLRQFERDFGERAVGLALKEGLLRRKKKKIELDGELVLMSRYSLMSWARQSKLVCKISN